MRFNKFIPALLIFTASITVAENTIPIIEHIEIIGNRRFSEREIIDWSGLRRGAPLDSVKLEEALHSILDGFADAGHFFASIDTSIVEYNIDSSQVNLTLVVSEGVIVDLEKVKVSDSSEVDLENLSALFNRRGAFYPVRLEEGIEEALNEVEEEGFPFCMLAIERLHLVRWVDSNPLYADLKLERGPRIHLAGVEIVGSKSTNSRFITRESRLKQGDLFSAEALRRARRYLLNTGLFRSVQPIELVRRRDDFHARITVEEGKNNSFDAVLGYLPGSAGKEGYFTGLLDFAFRNLFGTGRCFIFHWEQPDRDSQDLSVSYREPWVGGLPIDISIFFSQSVRAVSSFDTLDGDDRFLSRYAALDGYYQMNESFELTGGLIYSEVLPDSASRYIGIPHSVSTGVQGGFTVDTRDNRLNPRRGILYHNTAAILNKKNYPVEVVSVPDRVDERRIEADLEIALPISRWQVFDMRLSGRYLKSQQDLIPVSEMYYLGGMKSLRGYRELQFPGTAVAWANLEYRLLLGGYSRLFIFNDWGYFYRKIGGADSETESYDDFKYGYGAGIRLETGIGVIGVDYGLGGGVAPLEGMLHVRLRNEF